MFRLPFIIFILIIFYSSGVVAQTIPELDLPEDTHGTIRLNVSNILNRDNEKLSYHTLSVFVKNKREDYTSNAIQGRYKVEGNYLHFKPYFPFENGMTYVVKTLNVDSENRHSFRSFRLGEKKKVDEAKVVSIYPSASQLPENLLRFYVYFNTPMKKGQALNHIKLIDAEGNIDNHAFMEFKQELWSADGKRLTILFDPGRIKRGVSTNMQRGPALLEGKHYRLSISNTWQDVFGQKLPANTTKEIKVVKGYRQHLKVSDFTLDKPKANSFDALTVHFNRIIDHALIQSMIKINDANGNLIIGHWEILSEERDLKFIPEKIWLEGNYRVIIDSRLEDIAGNNLQNLLDHTQNDKEINSKSHYGIDFKI